MKRGSIHFILASFALLPGCTKSSLVPIDSSLIAKWSYVEYYRSIGGPGEWLPVEPANQKIEFKSDGSFLPAESFLKGVTNYEIVDSVTIKFLPASTPSGYQLMGYQIDTVERKLYLYPVNPSCIEGCSSKFRR